MNKRQIELRKVSVHNLQSVDLTLNAGELVVFTGVSGSGKSSMAFDTLYAEGQRRYIESLSTYARRQLGELAKPELESAEGLSPTISIEQKTAGRNPRSTVGTLTEIYDYMRVLWARLGQANKKLEAHHFSFNSPHGMCQTCLGLGVKDEVRCPTCKGARLNKGSLSITVRKLNIHEASSLTIDKALAFFRNFGLKGNEAIIATELIKEITTRLSFLIDVGLHYLTLSRDAPSLSGGEAQRVRLASQIGAELVGVTYVLDEPSIGLHPGDNARLLKTLKTLRDRGNTVLVVEHDEDTILEADRIVDFGPGAGSQGGRLLVNGTLSELLANKESVTASFLNGKDAIAVPETRRPARAQLTAHGATHHNLKNLAVNFPIGVFITVVGCSGSGKSSLVSEILFPALDNKLHRGEHPVGAHRGITGLENIDKVIEIDQQAIGRTPRSNPATFIKVFDDIRKLYASLPESVARGYKEGRFSFNVKEGCCTACDGNGSTKVDMDFMEDAWVKCEVCGGKRFDEETLSILYKGATIFDVLEMTITTAKDFFENQASIKKKLATIERVGLGYMTLGQASTTLSGGEAQRIKLAKELVRPGTGKTLYILDEPTTGLHFADVKKLLSLLHELVERGNTVLVIEHNMEVAKTADWIIEIGPEGGEKGGQLIAEGTPEQIAELTTPTAPFIKTALAMDVTKRAKAAAKSARERVLPEALTSIIVTGASQNNLKHISCQIPRQKMTVCTGPSGSGKSSFAFETLYAEGQRRYTESLSAYARQYINQSPKPKVESIQGLSPAIAVEQKASGWNPRSTVGTQTEVLDYLRIFYARLGKAYCPETGEPIVAISKEHVVERVLSWEEGTRILVLAPLPADMLHPAAFVKAQNSFKSQGYLRLRLNGQIYELDDEIPFDASITNKAELVTARLVVRPQNRSLLDEAVVSACKIGKDKLIVATDTEDTFFNLSFSVESTGTSYPELTSRSFSFNHKEGQCPDCEGLGYWEDSSLMSDPAIMNTTPLHLIAAFLGQESTLVYMDDLIKILTQHHINPHARLSSLSAEALNKLFFGSSTAYDRGKIIFRWRGLQNLLNSFTRTATGEVRKILENMPKTSIVCPSCQGSRLNPLSSKVELDGLTMQKLCGLPASEAYTFLQKLKIAQADRKILDEPLKQMLSRMQFMLQIGLGYLSLDRSAPTLSGGESQRIRLSRQLGAGLTGILYVLDEPTIGLHPSDNEKLSWALRHLVNLGNTVVLVEHDPITVQEADYVLEFGPGSGIYGGQLVAQGTVEQIRKDPASLTGRYLSGSIAVPRLPTRNLFAEPALEISHATAHNLKGISCKIPSKALTCITGVSGSGKSSLVDSVLLPILKQNMGLQGPHKGQFGVVGDLDHFSKVIYVDQEPLGQTVRSDVGTYVDVLSPIRSLFAKEPQAKRLHLTDGCFSYNTKAGACPACWGLGYETVNLQFLPSVRVSCTLCEGKRLNQKSLTVQYKGRDFGAVLRMTVDEAFTFFEESPKAKRILQALKDVGLGYLQLGQEVATLSGGEAQRVKLSAELAKRAQKQALFVMDEPTTGLHASDVHRLIGILHQLVQMGHTVLLIEHNVDVIAASDYIIELGSEAGAKGGYKIAEGSLDAIKNCPQSMIRAYL